MSEQTFVIVGGGQAGATCATELRKLGFAGQLIVIGEEDFLPYRRPPLSKAYLAGEATPESLQALKPPLLEKQNISFRGGIKVEAIDRQNKSLQLSDGSTQRYDKLALTIGGRARPLPLDGAEAANVFPLRTVADVDAIRAELSPDKRLVIVGGGFIGLEVAAVARKLGMTTTVLEGLPRVLARVTAPVVSSFFEQVHRAAGVKLLTSTQVAGFAQDGGRVHAVRLSDDSEIPADLVIYGIGLIPNTELAEQAGLAIDNGIVVDAATRTEDPDIVAAGDCTNHPNLFYDRRLRLESVNNAMEQGRVAAAAMLGQDAQYDSVPWFWSDQYDLKLQMVGLSTDHDDVVVRGDPASRSFSVFYLREGVIIAVDAISRPKDFMAAKKLVAARAAPDPSLLANEDTALLELA